MKKYNYEKGRLGEEAVTLYLERNGCDIVYRNFRGQRGEIDIIFLEDNILVFGEVKSRSSINYGYPSEAVDARKQKKIIDTAKEFIYRGGLNIYVDGEHKNNEDVDIDDLDYGFVNRQMNDDSYSRYQYKVRFDVFEVYLNDKKIRHIRSAFECM